MKPGELYTKTEYGSTYITLITEVNEKLDRYSYIHIYFGADRSYITRADSASTYCGPLDTSGWIDNKCSESCTWRLKVLKELKKHHFDTDFVQELWKELDRPVPIGYSVAKYYPQKMDKDLEHTNGFCATKQEAEALCEESNREHEGYPNEVIYIAIPVFKED